MTPQHAFLLLSLAATTAAAQTATVDAIEEIVVTAQRREERLQEVPAAISALSGVYLLGPVTLLFARETKGQRLL